MDSPSAAIVQARVLDRLSIRELNDAFGYCMDHGDCEGFLKIFTPDVHYRSGERVLSGKAEIRAFFEARARTGRLSRHTYSGLRIQFRSDDAVSTSVWTTYAGNGVPPMEGTQPFVVADVSDVYRQYDGQWLIAERMIDPVFVNSAIKPPSPPAAS